MPPRKGFVLTSQVEREIAAFIAAGGFPHVAAEAAGIPREVFEAWLELGSPVGRKKGWKPHRQYVPFWTAVMKARATARLRAEMAALSDDPIAWLRNGPGKDKPNDPGWSVGIKPVVHEQNTQINVLLSPEMQGIFASILQVLAPHPEARAAVAEALAGAGEFATGPKRIKQIEQRGSERQSPPA
jgi:hypothetical protein